MMITILFVVMFSVLSFAEVRHHQLVKRHLLFADHSVAQSKTKGHLSVSCLYSMMITTMCFIFTCSVLSLAEINHHIEKRYLLAQRYTVMQFSTGVTVPVVLPRRSINFSLVGQANYNMPYNLTNFQPLVISAREKEKSSYLDISRKNFYKYITELLDGVGLDGEVCLLRSICEISEFPMHIKEEETLLEKLVHFVFTPSLEYHQYKNETIDSQNKFTDRLLEAEQVGKENGDCERKYSDCIISLVDLFTAKYLVD